MARFRAFLGWFSRPAVARSVRGVPLLSFIAIVAFVPLARALLATGLAGGIVLGGLLILFRHHLSSSGPWRGTPIVLFPRTVDLRT
jgi:hypothetical protein